jgi:hypothetical protein
MSKGAKKSGAKSGHGELVDGPRGGKLRRGSKKGNTPGTGRPPNEFKERMQGLASQKNVEDYLKKCLRGDFGPKFHLSALQYATDRGYGKAAQPLEHSTPDGPLDVSVTYTIVDPE